MKTRTKRFLKLSMGAELRSQLVTSIKVRRGPANDNRDFEPVMRKSHSFKPIKVGIGDKGYDDEDNHELLRDELHALSIIPARYEDVPVWRTRGRYRKEMKRGYSKKKYHKRSIDETIFSVVKRTMGDEVRSMKARAQNNEMRLKIIAYNAARIVSLAHSLFRGFLQSPGEGSIKYSKPSRSRVVRIAQRARHSLVEKILHHFGVTFHFHSHGEYWIWGRTNLKKLQAIDASILHPLKHKKFVEMMASYDQRHYSRGTLRELALRCLTSLSTCRALAIRLDRSPSRVSQVLSALRLEGEARMYRVNSTFYWVRSDKAVTIISPEKWKILEQISIPARLSEIAKRVSRDEHAVKRRLQELERPVWPFAKTLSGAQSPPPTG